MIRYLYRRLLLGIPLLFLVSLLTFVTVALIPGDPAVQILGAGHTGAEYLAFDKKLGLQQPVLVQYWHWLDNVLHGTLGTSVFSTQSVFSFIGQRLPVTISLIAGATVVSLIVGVGLGVLSATMRGSFARVVDVLSWLGFAVPNFWLGLILVDLFAVRLKLFPASGYVNFGHSPSSWLKSLILPVLTLALFGATGIAKQTRDAMTDVMNSEFVVALRVAGLPRRSIIFRHALRNAAIPVVTNIGLFAVAMLGGTVLVEQVFVLPGLGSLAVQAASSHDLPVIEGVVVTFALIVIAVNLLIEVSYAWLNPRIRVKK